MGATSLHVDSSIARTLSGTTTTADDTPAVAMSLELADDTVYLVELVAVARDVAGVERAAYGVLGMFYREGGNATLEGALTSAFEPIETSAGMDATLVANGTGIDAQVTGKADTTIHWALTLWSQRAT